MDSFNFRFIRIFFFFFFIVYLKGNNVETFDVKEYGRRRSSNIFQRRVFCGRTNYLIIDDECLKNESVLFFNANEKSENRVGRIHEGGKQKRELREIRMIIFTERIKNVLLNYEQQDVTMDFVCPFRYENDLFKRQPNN